MTERPKRNTEAAAAFLANGKGRTPDAGAPKQGFVRLGTSTPDGQKNTSGSGINVLGEGAGTSVIRNLAEGLQERANRFGVQIPDTMALKAGKILLDRDSAPGENNPEPDVDA
jgi:hypothetical protein